MDEKPRREKPATDAQRPEAGSVSPRPVAPPAPVPAVLRGSPPPAPAEALHPDERAPSPPKPAGRPSGNAIPARPAVRRFDPGRAGALGKIRQAVHQLAAKIASPPAERSAPEPQAPRPAAPPKRTATRPAAVVVASAPPPPRTPAAFWERSYLSHSRLRTVR